MSIANSILKIAKTEVMKTNAKQIKEIELEIGELAGVEYESLDFALNVLTRNSEFENTKILILKPKGKAQCSDCKHLFEIDNFLSSCPECKSYNTIIISGKELRVKSLLIE
jgi:hydrogenase nickel incorporation protein HypA/HybF